MNIELGKSIPLSLQAVDGNPSMNIIATCIDNFGVVIAKVKMTHYENGLYLSNEVPMPDVKYVVAQYDSGDDNYEITSDVFYTVPKPQTEKFIVGEICKVEQNEFIIGTVTHETED